ncbi:MAG: cupin domain-containing protein [Planctomycetes bacterium]|nr:cupin domain-containing protein [Planctomycetota bacterium]
MRTCLPALALLLAGCGDAPSPRIITPALTIDQVAWTAADLVKPIAVRPLRSDADSTAMLIRLDGAERPHVHAEHDLVVVLRSGRGVIHLDGRSHEIGPGDVMEIPRGVVHWAESDGGPCEVYAVFTGTYDGSDVIPVR